MGLLLCHVFLDALEHVLGVSGPTIAKHDPGCMSRFSGEVVYRHCAAPHSCVTEVGMGGRDDTTNVLIEPAVPRFQH